MVGPVLCETSELMSEGFHTEASLFELAQWCKDFSSENNCIVNPKTRFCIDFGADFTCNSVTNVEYDDGTCEQVSAAYHMACNFDKSLNTCVQQLDRCDDIAIPNEISSWTGDRRFARKEFCESITDPTDDSKECKYYEAIAYSCCSTYNYNFELMY